jgi:hypothetical protein
MTYTNAVAPVFHPFLGGICSRVLESAYNTARLLTGSAAESILACALDHVAMNHGCSQHCALHGCRQVKSVGCAGILALKFVSASLRSTSFNFANVRWTTRYIC